MTNPRHTVLYAGMTSNLQKRNYEHEQKLVNGFTHKYNATKLVFFEVYDDPLNAIARAKQIKRWSRIKKIRLIETQDKQWENLSDQFD